MYGISFAGGANNVGVLYEYNIGSSTYTKKVDFVAATTGSSPQCGVIEGIDSKIYGTCTSGGSNSIGTLFSYDIVGNTFTALFHFVLATGSQPIGTILQDAITGKIYGTTRLGGTNSNGVIFEFNLTGNVYTVLRNNTEQNYGQMQIKNNILYGLTTGGSFFKFDLTTNVYTSIKQMQKSNGSSLTGLIRGSNGLLYGSSTGGGTNGGGVIFSFDIKKRIYTKLYDFTSTDKQQISTVYEHNKRLYGVTRFGGVDSNGNATNFGTIYEYNIENNFYTRLHSFNSTQGANPYASLIQVNNILYGTTSQGGANSGGTIFKYDLTTKTFTHLIDFPNGSWNASVTAEFIVYTNNILYCISATGGIFRYIIDTNTLDIVYSNFGSNPLPGQPKGISLGKDNMFYITCRTGGANNYGQLGKWDPVGLTYSALYDFDLTNGNSPVAKLLHLKNNKLYGMTSLGGLNGKGVIFTWSVANGIEIISHNSISYGSVSNSHMPSFIEGFERKLYNLIGGGAYGFGQFIELDIDTNIITKLYDIVGIAGSSSTNYGVMTTLPA